MTLELLKISKKLSLKEYVYRDNYSVNVSYSLYFSCETGHYGKSLISVKIFLLVCSVFIFMKSIQSLPCHEQVCLSGLCFERYFSHHRET